MTVELALVISVVSVAFSIFFGLKNNKRSDTKEVEERTKERITEIEERTKENAIINVKLDNINSSNLEIKDRLNSVAKQIQEHGDRLIKVEESTKSAHHRINSLEERFNEREEKE